MKSRKKIVYLVLLRMVVSLPAMWAAEMDMEEGLFEESAPSPQHQLLKAIWAEDAEAVRSALKAGAAINVPDKLGCVPFLVACREPAISMDVIFSLLEAGADVHATDRHGKTALYFACKNARADLVSFFLNKRVAVDAATLVCAMDDGISVILRESVDRLVAAAYAGDDVALEQCKKLQADCITAVADFQILIERRKAARNAEMKRYAMPVQCDDPEMIPIAVFRHKGLISSCDADMDQYQRSIELLLSYKKAYAKYTDV